jgi:NAD-dependent DNA ligase
MITKILKQSYTITACTLLIIPIQRRFNWLGNTYSKVLGNVELSYTCELKYDGASISITYEDGKLKRAVTRGDGFQGDD